MNTSMSDLPTEILERILTILYEEYNIPALKACLQTNRLLHTLSQRLLRREIHFPELIGDYTHTDPITVANKVLISPAQRFIHDLDRSPHIAQYVKVLTIESFLTTAVEAYNMAGFWYTNDIDVGTFLPRLVNLQKLSIRRHSLRTPTAPRLWILNQRPQIVWSSMSGEFKASITHLFASNRLTEVDLTDMREFPANLFALCSSLKRLSLASLSFEETSSPTIPIVDSTPCQLEYLHIDDTEYLKDILGWLFTPLCPLDVSRLRMFSLFLDLDFEINDVGFLSWKDLKHLWLKTEIRDVMTKFNQLNYVLDTYWKPMPNLQDVVALESLTIDAVLFVRIVQHHTLIDFLASPLPWITAFLENFRKTSPSADTLSRLTVNLTFYDFTEQLVDLISWEEFTHCVSSENFPNLSKVRLGVTGLTREELGLLRCNEHLAKLVGRGLLEFT